MKPTHYTNGEGYRWLKWGSAPFDPKWLEYRKKREVIQRIDGDLMVVVTHATLNTVKMGRRKVHSLSIRKNGKNLWRWDYINGVTEGRIPCRKKRKRK